MQFPLTSSRAVHGRAPRGSTLLLALLVLAGFVATSFAVSAVIVNRVRGVRQTDQAIVASYAAETGIEDILYRVRRERQLVNLDGAGSLPGGAAWERRVVENVDDRYLYLAQDIPQQLDIFPASGAFDAAADAPIVRALRVAPVDLVAGAASDAAWLEVTWVPWLRSGEWATSIGRSLLSPSDFAGGEAIINLLQHPVGEEPVGYRIRFLARSAALGTVRVRAASDTLGNDLIAFPAGIRANVTGTFAGTRHAVRVEFPAALPLASTFDYVLFSECDIVKGGTSSCP
ncbi:MAG: hypothetical protein Q7T01_03905 [bacterium]|nr:hypothetical protein [bacterium]